MYQRLPGFFFLHNYRDLIPFSAFSWELVVHSTEWTTGSKLFLTFVLFSAFSEELVVHSTEWTTGSKLFLTFDPFPAFSQELVVHSTEWTTGSNKSPALAISAGL